MAWWRNAAATLGTPARRSRPRQVLRPVRFLFGALALTPLVWIATVEVNAVGDAHRLFGLDDVENSLVNQAFWLWLLGLLVALAFVLVSARVTPVQAEPALASGSSG
jgi:hypothetical protein